MSITVVNKNKDIQITINEKEFIKRYLEEYAAPDCTITDEKKFIELMSQAIPIIMSTSEFWDRLESEAEIYSKGVVGFNEG